MGRLRLEEAQDTAMALLAQDMALAQDMDMAHQAQDMAMALLDQDMAMEPQD